MWDEEQKVWPTQVNKHPTYLTSWGRVNDDHWRDNVTEDGIHQERTQFLDRMMTVMTLTMMAVVMMTMITGVQYYYFLPESSSWFPTAENSGTLRVLMCFSVAVTNATHQMSTRNVATWVECSVIRIIRRKVDGKESEPQASTVGLSLIFWWRKRRDDVEEIDGFRSMRYLSWLGN